MFFFGDRIYKRKLVGIIENNNNVVCCKLMIFIIFFVEYVVISCWFGVDEIFELVRIFLCLIMLIRICDL